MLSSNSMKQRNITNRRLHMKKLLLIMTMLSALIAIPAFPSPKEDAVNIINNAETIEKNLEINQELNAYYPFDVFSRAILDVTKARNYLDDKKYSEAYYHGSMATVRLEIARLVAQARLIRYQKMKLLSDLCGSGARSNALMDANFFKKGPVFRAVLFDRQVFLKKNNRIFYQLDLSGKDKLGKIIKVMLAYPKCKLKIAGHSDEVDNSEYTRRKAEVVLKYFLEKNVPPDRIEAVGMGNKEVMETHLGYRRVSRVEFILTGLK
jgi:hypothetical protein